MSYRGISNDGTDGCLDEQDGSHDSSDSGPEAQRLGECDCTVEVHLVQILVVCRHGSSVGEGAVDDNLGGAVDIRDGDHGLVQLLVVTILDQLVIEVLIVNVVASANAILGADADDVALLVASRARITVAVAVGVRVVVCAVGPESGVEGHASRTDGVAVERAARGVTTRRVGHLGATSVVCAAYHVRLGTGAVS